MGRLYLCASGSVATTLIGMSIASVAAIVLASVSAWPNPWVLSLIAFVLGFGLGWSAAPTLIAAQSSVGWGERGAVTGMNAFAALSGQRRGSCGVRGDLERGHRAGRRPR